LGSVDIYELYIFAQTKISRLAAFAGLETTINSVEDTRNKVGPSSMYVMCNVRAVECAATLVR
jgi:hypothetical protein